MSSPDTIGSHKLALETLQCLPREDKFSGNDAMDDAFILAKEVWETDTGFARDLLCAAMVHLRYAYYLAPDFANLDNEVGEAARKGQEVIISESSDDSRRNVMVNCIIRNEDDNHVVPRLLGLLTNDWVLSRHYSELVLKSLIARGEKEKAVAVLNRVVNNKHQPAEHQQTARELIMKFSGDRVGT
jgi:hypothetical protein